MNIMNLNNKSLTDKIRVIHTSKSEAVLRVRVCMRGRLHGSGRGRGCNDLRPGAAGGQDALDRAAGRETNVS